MSTFFIINSAIGVLIMLALTASLKIKFLLKNIIFCVVFGGIAGLAIPLSLITIGIVLIYLKKTGGLARIMSMAIQQGASSMFGQGE